MEKIGVSIAFWVFIIMSITGIIYALISRRSRLAALEADRLAYEEYQRRKARAIWAGATVVSLRTAALSHGITAIVQADLTLRVTPPGGEPYTANASWRVKLESLASLQPGAEISVKIDQENPQTIYPNL
jgi:hypothetical protein